MPESTTDTSTTIQSGENGSTSITEPNQIYNARLGKSREIRPFSEELQAKIAQESQKSDSLEDLSRSDDLHDRASQYFSEVSTKIVPQIEEVILELRRLGLEKDMLFPPELELVSHGLKTDLWGKTQRKDNPQIDDQRYVEDPENPLNKVAIDEAGNVSISLFGDQKVNIARLRELLTQAYKIIDNVRKTSSLTDSTGLNSWVEHQAVSRGILAKQGEHEPSTVSLENANFVKRFTNGVDAKQVSNPVELWESKDGRRIIVKRVPETAEHTLNHEVLESEILRMMGIPSPETTIQMIDGRPVLVLGFLEGYREEVNPFELTDKYHVNRVLQRGLLVDLWLNQYNRRPHNIMMKDGKIQFIDHGAAAYSRATGGFKGFSSEVTITNAWDLLHTIPDDNPSGEVPVNEAYSKILEVQGGPERGTLVVRDPEFLRTEIRRLEKIGEDQIRSLVIKAGYPSGEESIPIAESMLARANAERARLHSLLITPFDQWEPKLQQKGYMLPDGSLSPRFHRDLRWAEEAQATFQRMIDAGGIQEYMIKTLIDRKSNLIDLLKSAMPEEEVSKEISISQVEEVARSAGDIINAYYQIGASQEYKSERQVVTAADERAEETIREGLLRIHQASFFGEESGGEFQTKGDQWIVDPLDGTENMQGYPPTIGISIALMRNGEPILGVIYDPIHHIMYSGEKGKGIRVDGKPAKVSDIQEASKARIGFDFSSKLETRQRTIEQVERVMGKMGARTGKLVGAPVLSLAAVSSGKLELFFRPSTKLTDLAAGVLLVREAGGRVLDYNGEEWTVSSEGIIAGAPQIVDEFLPSLMETEEPTLSALTRTEKPETSEVINNPDLLRLEAALPRILAEKAKGKTIVITNGHFALTHPGHSVSLEQARKIGQESRPDHKNEGVVLLVIVNNDPQTQAKDPIKASAGTESERAINVLDNRHSDIVIISGAPQGDNTLTTDFQRLAESGVIDENVIYVKGGDYGTEESVPPEAEIIQQNGGRFLIVPRIGNFSTTNQVERILEAAKKSGHS